MTSLVRTRLGMTHKVEKIIIKQYERLMQDKQQQEKNKYRLSTIILKNQQLVR
jgi:hypothetical protein